MYSELVPIIVLKSQVNGDPSDIKNKRIPLYGQNETKILHGNGVFKYQI